jgi:hypothetical protein
MARFLTEADEIQCPHGGKLLIMPNPVPFLSCEGNAVLTEDQIIYRLFNGCSNKPPCMIIPSFITSSPLTIAGKKAVLDDPAPISSGGTCKIVPHGTTYCITTNEKGIQIDNSIEADDEDTLEDDGTSEYDAMHKMAAVGGLLATGPLSIGIDIADGILYWKEGDKVSAVWSFVSAMPIVGIAGEIMRTVRWINKTKDKVKKLKKFRGKKKTNLMIDINKKISRGGNERKKILERSEKLDIKLTDPNLKEPGWNKYEIIDKETGKIIHFDYNYLMHIVKDIKLKGFLR